MTKVYDLNGAFGGPIKKDRVWFFVNARTQGSTQDDRQHLLQPECRRPDEVDRTRRTPSQPAYTDRTWENISGARHVAGHAAQQDQRLLGRAGDLPEVRRADDRASPIRRASRPRRAASAQTKPLRVPQVTWSSPVTNRLLLDAGFGGVYYGWGNFERDPNPTRDLDPRRRTVRERLRRQRQHSRAWSTARRTAGTNYTGVVQLAARRPRTSPARTA